MRLIRNPKFNSYASLFHGQGKTHQTAEFKRMADLFFDKAKPVRWFDNVAIITFSNQGKPFASKCLDALKIDHAWCGQDIENFWFGRKIPIVYQFAKTTKAAYVMWLDGFDVLPADPVRAMEDYWEHFDGQMLFGGQAKMWRRNSAPDDFYDTLPHDTMRYPNSGVCISPRDLILKWVPRAQEFAHRFHDDQDRWNNVLPEAYPEITTDSRCKIIQCWPSRTPFPLELLA